MSLYQWMSILGIPTIIGILIGIFIKKPIERRLAESEAKAEELRKQNEAVKKGIQALLRDRLLQVYMMYESRGWASYEEKSNVENLHTQYSALGQNGIMDTRHEHFIQLPDHE